jgi:uncharacterized membrane protein YuzA (DUF378 family)
MDLYTAAVFLLIVGGLNWGSVGLLGKDLVALCCGRGSIGRAVYIAVGLSAVLVGLRFFNLTEGFAAAAAAKKGKKEKDEKPKAAPKH